MTTLETVIIPGFTNGYVSFDTPSAINVTGSSATAFTVQKTAGSDYAFQVDTSATNAVTGLVLTSKAAASGMALSVRSTGSDEALTIDAKGTGTITLGGTSTGAITLTRATTATVSLTTPALVGSTTAKTPALDGVAPTGAGLTIGAGSTSKLGFYGHAVTAQQTGVAVTAAGIHAACVALGLFTA